MVLNVVWPAGTFAKPTVIPAYAGIYRKSQLGGLVIWTYYRCSTEFCKGLHQGRGVLVIVLYRCLPCLVDTALKPV